MIYLTLTPVGRRERDICYVIEYFAKKPNSYRRKIRRNIAFSPKFCKRPGEVIEIADSKCKICSVTGETLTDELQTHWTVIPGTRII